MEKHLDLEDIYLLYINDLYAYIFSLCKNKSLAEDIVQETFYRACLYLETDNIEKIKPWLFKVAYHTFIDVIRKDKRLVQVKDDEVLNHLLDQNQVKSAEDEYMVKDQLNDWFRVVDQLTLYKRNVILLREYYQLSYQEIADMLNISLSKVKVTLYRGRKEIEKKLD
ncbi:RNA polymerase sigma factor [Halolactibacillus miurensis]|uniref:RNA polymerase sigma factor n=1 Tax=Halolactibacillus miurensis TaxID=306541 RepID=A0A1I6PL55_9BACI|nr:MULTISPECIES: sigma-70 family RNA polymerase sigma factor [Halolactibacillus]GEM03780.1 RNA polymerase sigma factor [Halolactibacillus miurensis]SFS40785.1 RNA polymerase sigma-70 factor, ECF subfamily [Halolactibacillus miurensis]